MGKQRLKSHPISRLSAETSDGKQSTSFRLRGTIVRLALLFWGIAVLSVLLALTARLPPSNAPERLLQDSNCVPPCLLGLHPGQTELSEALATLRSNPWLSNVVVSQELQRAGTGFLFLEWSGRQPDLLNDRLVASVWIEQGQVALIRLPLTATLGSLALEFEPVEPAVFTRLSNTNTMADTPLAQGLSARTTLRCPFRRSQMWSQQPELRAGETTIPPTAPGPDEPVVRPCTDGARQ